MSEIVTRAEAVLQELGKQFRRERCPQATYRLQFHPEHLTFRAAAAIVPYLSRLGVSHVYASPYVKARSGSPHRYAIVDYGQLDPGLGAREDYDAFVAALREHGMGHVLDVVPSHMSTAPGENGWWTDVLESGPSSPYADFFDIDWGSVREELRNRILLPVLGRQFGEALEAGELALGYRDGSMFVKYFDNEFPLDPKTYPAVLTRGIDEFKEAGLTEPEHLRELESIVTAAEHLPERTRTAPEHVEERQREKEVIKDRLRRLVARSAEVAALVARNLEELNGRPDEPASYDELEKILNAQVYRLSHWKAASDEINYRRFFDVNELAAVCMEHREVFEASHAFVFDLLARGDVDGLRVDHVDGLFDPLEYLWRLQWGYVRAVGRRVCERLGELAEAPAAHGPAPQTPEAVPSWEEVEPIVLAAFWPELGGPSPFELLGVAEPAHGISPARMSYASGPDEPAATGRPPLYVVVEKILGPEEPLPSEWPVAGTTGYEFLNSVGGLFLDRPGMLELAKFYRRFTQEQASFHEVAYRCKLLILRVAMSSELYLLAHQLKRISERHRLSRDFTLNSLRTALREVLACFPVYRTYISNGSVSGRDDQVVRRAVARARYENPAMDAAVFDFIRGVLLLEQPPKLDDAGYRRRASFVGRFQQTTSPIMAKGVEDTAFYRHVALVSANEVGGEPTRAAVSPEQFHEENEWRRSAHPCSLTCTSTHDTKRSEDMRARIDVLSEIPGTWRSTVNRWARLNRRFHGQVDGLPAPSRNDEYLLYQTLLGVWPLETPGPEEHEELTRRLVRYMEKATREAKVRTSWISPNPDYDEAVRQFVLAVLRADPGNTFLNEFRQFHESVVDWGLYTALSQVVLKATSPGVPDTYQGQELWDFSLVDPDNRRPVDYGHRQRLLGELETRVASGGEDALSSIAREIGKSPRDPRLKLFATWRTLHARRRHPDLFRSGRYWPLRAEGSRADHVCAFVRSLDATAERPAERAVVVVPRLLARLTPRSEGDLRPAAPLGTAVWADTRLAPAAGMGREFVNDFTGQRCVVDSCPVATLLSDFPVAVMIATEQ